MLTTEGSTLIAHVLNAGVFTDAQLSKVLMISPRRYDAYKEGSKETPRVLTETLAILAEHVGYGASSLSKADALTVRPQDHVMYNGEDCLVLATSKSGVLAPYFSLLGKGGIFTSVPYRLCADLPDEETETEPSK